jgi:hypothetical protein
MNFLTNCKFGARVWACAPSVLLATVLLSVQTHASGLLVEAGSSLVVPPGGSIELNCSPLMVEGVLDLGDGEILDASDTDIAPGGVFDAGSGLVTVGGNWSNNGSFLSGSSTVLFPGTCSGGTTSISGDTAFCNVTLGSGQTYVLSGNFAIDPACTLDLGQNNTLQSDSPGSNVQFTLGLGATVLGSASLAGVIIGALSSMVAQPIPTLGVYSIALLSLLLGVIGWRRERQFRGAQVKS